MLRASIWDGPPVWRLVNSNLQIRASSQIEACSIQGHGPRMLNASNSRSWYPKTSNSKVNILGPSVKMLKASIWDGPPIWRFGRPNTSKSKLLASRAWPQDVQSFEFEVLGSKNIEFEGFNILGSSAKLPGC